MHFSCFFSFLIKFTGFYLYRNTLLTSPLSSTHTLSFWIHRWPASHQPPSSTPSAPSSSPHLATCPDNVSVVCFPASNKRVRRRHPRSLRPAPCSKKKKKPFSKSIDALFVCEASCPRELVCINTSWGLMKASGGLRTPSFSVLSARPKPHQAICSAQSVAQPNRRDLMVALVLNVSPSLSNGVGRCWYIMQHSLAPCALQQKITFDQDTLH